MDRHPTLQAAPGSGPATDEPAKAIREAEDWAAAAHEAGRRLEALDAATVAISQELSLERVLQIIVDSVRPLVGASYAALGIPDERGSTERFITSGISEGVRRAIGQPPRGHGLLGVIIREGRPCRVTDIAADPRSVGFPPHHPPMHSFLGVPVRVEGRVIGNLYLTDKAGGRPFSEDDERLVESFARHAGLAIHNARMHEELRQLAVLQERERIAQDLHDGSIQSLYGVSLALEDTAELMQTDPAMATQRIDRAIETIHGTIQEIRDFILGLDPEARTTMDLLAGLTALTDEFERSTLIDVELSSDPEVPLDPDETLQLIQLTREAMSNVARHAQASKVSVNVEDRRDALRLSIIDDGRGFDTREGQRPGHHGLTNMHARAESLGGSLTIVSGHDGTRVVFEMPRGDRSQGKESST
ncbi:MAG TPA: GAF domain-containing sensor histidine kinase [Candidatus Limnocylindrales bacterium]|nr:GAF domain-containing sensor histidine kinase [Candidatus Limnocylindrales bacterium]